MCGRYVQAKTTLELAEAFDATPVDDGPPTAPSWNVAPTMTMPVVVRRSGQGRRELRVMRWGLVPSWATDPSIGSRLINARVESLADKPAFRTAVARRRCLIPADGWYEWMALGAGPGGRPRKQPFWFSAADGTELALAGLFEHWKPKGDPDAAWTSSYTVITTTAIDGQGHVHDRSPLPVPASAWDRWLDRARTDAAEAVALLVPPDPEQITAWPVSTAVGSVRNDDPSLIAALPLEP